MARRPRAAAGLDVVVAAQRLMDELLTQEQACFEQIADGVQAVAVDVARRVETRARSVGKTGLRADLPAVLPDREVVAERLLPPVGDLLAVTRERTLVVVWRQMRMCESAVGLSWQGLATAAAAAARAVAGQLETTWFERAQDAVADQVLTVRAKMVRQADVWWLRREELAGLVARWCSPDPVRLVGAEPRGVVWELRGRMVAEARNASVALSNGLILAGLSGWNAAVTARSA